MCYDLSEYDPFEPIIFDYDYNDEWFMESFPMEEYDWKEWLEGGNEHQD